MSDEPEALRQEGPRILKRWLAQYKKPTLVSVEKMLELQVKKMHDKLDLYNPWFDDHNYMRMTKPYPKNKEEKTSQEEEEHLDSTEEMDTGDFDIYSAVEIEDFEAQEIGKGESSGASWCVRKFDDALTELVSNKQENIEAEKVEVSIKQDRIAEEVGISIKQEKIEEEEVVVTIKQERIEVEEQEEDQLDEFNLSLFNDPYDSTQLEWQNESTLKLKEERLSPEREDNGPPAFQTNGASDNLFSTLLTKLKMEPVDTQQREYNEERMEVGKDTNANGKRPGRSLAGRDDGRKYIRLENRPFTQEEKDYYKFDGTQYQDDGDPWGFKAEMEQLKKLVKSKEATQQQQIAPSTDINPYQLFPSTHHQIQNPFMNRIQLPQRINPPRPSSSAGAMSLGTSTNRATNQNQPRPVSQLGHFRILREKKEEQQQTTMPTLKPEVSVNSVRVTQLAPPPAAEKLPGSSIFKKWWEGEKNKYPDFVLKTYKELNIILVYSTKHCSGRNVVDKQMQLVAVRIANEDPHNLNLREHLKFHLGCKQVTAGILKRVKEQTITLQSLSKCMAILNGLTSLKDLEDECEESSPVSSKGNTNKTRSKGKKSEKKTEVVKVAPKAIAKATKKGKGGNKGEIKLKIIHVSSGTKEC